MGGDDTSELEEIERCFSKAVLWVELEERMRLLDNIAEQRAVFEAVCEAVLPC